MRSIKAGLVMGALLSVALATNAQAVSTETTWTATGTGSSGGGSKSEPAPFSGDWHLNGVNNANPAYRQATPQSWSWSWEGVTVNQQGFPVCTAQQINDAKSVAGCPAGSHIGIGQIPAASFGPAGLAEGPNTNCLGKTFDLYNGEAGVFTVVIDGPPEQCATLGFLGAFPVVLATSGGKTTMTYNIAENLQHPLPGADGTLQGGQMVFNKLTAKSKSAGATAAKKGKKKKKKKKTLSLYSSVGCTGTRDFTYTVVDTFGTHVINTNTGNCNAPKKKKGKKK